jgi:hypothetical protein
MFNAHYSTVSQFGDTRYVDKATCEHVAMMNATPEHKVPHRWFCAQVVVSPLVTK